MLAWTQKKILLPWVKRNWICLWEYLPQSLHSDFFLKVQQKVWMFFLLLVLLFFSSPVIFSFVFLLIRREILLLPSTMSLKELRKGLFIFVVLIPFSYGCAQCLKWWEHLHVVSEYIYFDKLSRDETWKFPYSTFLSVMSFQFQSSFISSMSSSFPMVKSSVAIFIYFVMNEDFGSCFPRAHIGGKGMITRL